MSSQPGGSGGNVDWPSPRAEQLPRFFDPESPGGGINCSTDLYVQAIMLGSRSKGNKSTRGRTGTMVRDAYGNRSYCQPVDNSGRTPAEGNKILLELRCKGRRMGGRIPLIPQNELGWQQQQQ
ncbi:hypothetical protein PspLS_08556 [Pyricularia sp. CBS 133598]|nr:hypothetical protein PspLS_08556 [Pyricularia sp. CBS 133598]